MTTYLAPALINHGYTAPLFHHQKVAKMNDFSFRKDA